MQRGGAGGEDHKCRLLVEVGDGVEQWEDRAGNASCSDTEYHHLQQPDENWVECNCSLYSLAAVQLFGGFSYQDKLSPYQRTTKTTTTATTTTTTVITTATAGSTETGSSTDSSGTSITASSTTVRSAGVERTEHRILRLVDEAIYLLCPSNGSGCGMDWSENSTVFPLSLSLALTGAVLTVVSMVVAIRIRRR